jgi:type IV pilus biogenesis protein PilP
VWAQNLPTALPVANTQTLTDLCPDAQSPPNNTGNNLNDVQADIDRLGLCVERAKLLQELDELVTKRQALLTGENANGLNLPPLPLSSNQANLQIKPQAPALDNQTITTTLNRATPPNPPTQPGPANALAATNNGAWFIQRIWGQSPNMQAQLINTNNSLATVSVGEPLTDGYAVESISARGVILSRAGKLTNLDWEKKPTTPTKDSTYAQPTLTE